MYMPMYQGYYGYVALDWTYFLLLGAIILSVVTSIKVNTTYAKYSKTAARCGLTAEQAVERVLQANGVYGVGIARVSGSLTDNYNPKTNIISLSETVYGSSSIAAIGVACHEAGHAIQHEKEYGPARLRMAMVPITNIGARFSGLLLILGFFLGIMGFIWAGIALFSVTTAFQLVTLPTEFDASRRALSSLREYGLLTEDELVGTKKVLTSAAMTYVASLAISLITLFRYISIAKKSD